jgi:hypothetical protein
MEGTSVLDSLSTIFTKLMDMAGDVVTFIGDNPLCLIPIGIFVAGAAVGLLKRIF